MLFNATYIDQLSEGVSYVSTLYSHNTVLNLYYYLFPYYYYLTLYKVFEVAKLRLL